MLTSPPFKQRTSIHQVLNQIKCLFSMDMEYTKSKFLVVLTSHRLLKNIIDQCSKTTQPSFFHIDATCKLMQSGFLLLALSTEDPSHRGRLCALALSLHEDTTSYLTFLNSIKDFFKEKKDFCCDPKYVLSDGAESINNAVIQVFPQITHILCFFHLKKA